MLATSTDARAAYVAGIGGVNLRGPELSKNPPPHVIRRLKTPTRRTLRTGDGCLRQRLVFAPRDVCVARRSGYMLRAPPASRRVDSHDDEAWPDRREELDGLAKHLACPTDMHGRLSLGTDGRIYWCAPFPHET